mgnify:CR=1 FL=1
MIPVKILRAELRRELIDYIEKLIEFWYTNMELSKMLWAHKNTISWLRIKKEDYPIALKKVEPMLKKAKDLLKNNP